MRSAGILMPISSLQSPYGIGTFGEKSYEFVDFLASAKQKYWQILPIGHTGYGDSPYQSFSAFAIGYYYIDLDMLLKDGLLTKKELSSYNYDKKAKEVDYFNLYNNRKPLLEKAVKRFDVKAKDFVKFRKKNAFWLKEYATFMNLKAANDMVGFSQWDDDLKYRKASKISAVIKEYGDETLFWEVTQYFAYTQWAKLKKYANSKGVSIIGDIPIYVSPDSSDLWANPELFQTDSEGKLTEVAGCPPDAFSADGQLWGNPLYDWDYHAAQEFKWWKTRLENAFTLFDVVRIDHFRGFSGYYAIPAGDDTAKNGRWRVGPGLAIIEAVKLAFPNNEIIAEDLGYLTYDVRALLKESGFPGMKVLQFAFDSREPSDYLPHNYDKNCVVYTGTHDNTTTEDWQFSAAKEDVAFCKEYVNISEGDEFALALIRSAFSSAADTAIIPMPDWLALGKEARINTPSTVGGNWVWKIEKKALTKDLAKKIERFTRIYGRG